MTGPAGAPAHQHLSYIVAGAQLVIIGFIFIHWLNGFIWPDAFFDVRVFGRTIDAIRAGHGPYDLIHGPNPDLQLLPLVQPPLVARGLELIAAAPVPALLADALLSLLTLSGIAAAIYFSARLFFDTAKPTLFFCAGLFASFICGAGMIALVTGNISGLFWGCIFAGAWHGVQHRRWTAFHVAVFAASLFKPFFITLWLVPALAHGWSWRQVFIGAACCAGVVASYALSFWSMPDLTSAWLAALDSRRVVGDVGGGLFALVRTRQPFGDAGALAVQGLYALILVISVMVTRAEGRLRLAALFVAAIIVSPRLNAYDYCYAAIPVFFIAHSLLVDLAGERRGAILGVGGAVLVALLSTMMFLLSQSANNLFLVVALGGAVLAAAHWPALRERLPLATSGAQV